MSQVVINYIDSLPKESITKEELIYLLDNKIGEYGRGAIYIKNSEIYRITDTLFYVKTVTSQHIYQHFVETAYENMLIIFSLYYRRNTMELVISELFIYKLIEEDVWRISFVNGNEDIRITSNNDNIYGISEIPPGSSFGQYLSLAGEYADEASFVKKLVSFSPIILPSPIPNFEGKIEEAFTYLLQEGVTGIQFIDIDPETI